MNWHTDTNYYGEPYDFRGKPRPMDWRDIFTLEDTLKNVRKQIRLLTKYINYKANLGGHVANCYTPPRPLIEIRNNLRKEMRLLAEQIKVARYEAYKADPNDDL